MKKVISLFLSICMLLSIIAGLNLTAHAETISGKCGDNVTWSLDTSTGELTISGTGAMNDYNYCDYTPWYSYKNSIIKATIKNNVTGIGKSAFGCCKLLKSVTIPNSVTSIGSSAFHDTALYNNASN